MLAWTFNYWLQGIPGHPLKPNQDTARWLPIYIDIYILATALLFCNDCMIMRVHAFPNCGKQNEKNFNFMQFLNAQRGDESEVILPACFSPIAMPSTDWD